MFDAATLPLFLAASWALIIAPGPDMIYVISRGMAQGRKAGLYSALGVTLGLLVHTLSAALGLAVVFQTSALAFLVIKYAGAGYLIYLGFKALRDKAGLVAFEADQPMGFGTIFWQGVLSNVLNPKVALFFLAFLPQFVNPFVGQTMAQMLSLGLLFAFLGLVFLLTLAYFSGSVGQWLARKQRAVGILRWVTGGTLIGLGVRLALTERR